MLALGQDEQIDRLLPLAALAVHSAKHVLEDDFHERTARAKDSESWVKTTQEWLNSLPLSVLRSLSLEDQQNARAETQVTEWREGRKKFNLGVEEVRRAMAISGQSPTDDEVEAHIRRTPELYNTLGGKRNPPG
jgi:hypothetical protein